MLAEAAMRTVLTAPAEAAPAAIRAAVISQDTAPAPLFRLVSVRADQHQQLGGTQEAVHGSMEPPLRRPSYLPMADPARSVAQLQVPSALAQPAPTVLPSEPAQLAAAGLTLRTVVVVAVAVRPVHMAPELSGLHLLLAQAAQAAQAIADLAVQAVQQEAVAALAMVALAQRTLTAEEEGAVEVEVLADPVSAETMAETERFLEAGAAEADGGLPPAAQLGEGRFASPIRRPAPR